MSIPGGTRRYYLARPPTFADCLKQTSSDTLIGRPSIPKSSIQYFRDLQAAFIILVKISAEGERDRRAFCITPICRMSP